jgi:hypothetical protein
MVVALRRGLLTYRAFLDVYLARRTACFARLDARALAALRGFATDAFLVT